MDNGTDRNGIETAYTYDAYKRRTSAKVGDYVTSYTYDAAGRRLATTNSADAVSDVLVSETQYDMLGRPTAMIDESGLETSMAYDDGTLTVTNTYPGDGTRIVTKYADGRTKSVGGTAVVKAFHEYGAENGRTWHKVYTGSERLLD